VSPDCGGFYAVAETGRQASAAVRDAVAALNKGFIIVHALNVQSTTTQ